MLDVLKAIPLFADLPEQDLATLAEGVDEVALRAGEVLFKEGEEGHHAYVVTAGEIEITKASAGRELLLAVKGPGMVVGEMALLEEAPRSATVRARSDTRLLRIPKAQLDALLAASPTAVRALFAVVLGHWRSTQVTLRQSERMAQLGTLTAGLAHELNNPAAAVRRGSEELREAVTEYAEARAALAEAGLGDSVRPTLDELRERARTHAGHPPDLDPLTRSDREDEIESWLEDHDVGRAWEIAPVLVDLDLDEEALDTIVRTFGDGVAPLVLRWLRATHTALTLVSEVEEAAGRMSAIVKALKSYSYLDQAPLQEVDLAAGLDDTLLIMKSKIKDIAVRRSYAPDLPRIEGYGSELNQVWTNLIDNAADAVHATGRSDGKIIIRAFRADGRVAVEIEDNGTGIPDAIRDRVFDSFFTTKPPGSGTGLGLDISYGIVVHRHRGNISVSSEPGRTTFRVELPLRAPEGATGGRSTQ